MLICERIMPSSIRFVIILPVLLIVALIETARLGSRSANCPVCVFPSLAHCRKLLKPDGSHVSFNRLVMKATQTRQFALRLPMRLPKAKGAGEKSVKNWVIARETRRYEDSRVSMGCVYTIVVYGHDMTPLRQAAAAALDEVDRIDRLMSHYKKGSELSRVNREVAKSPVKVDPELFDFIAECLRYSRASGGAFDITVGPLMKAWGFFRGEGRMPTETELAEARNRIGYQHVILNQRDKTIFFDKAGVELDLGGIAKGYAVDRAVTMLKQYGVASALVSAGGSTIYAMGAPPGKPAWEVEVQDPVDQKKIAMTVRLKDRALSVSGSYEKFFELDGVRYSHVMDPRTGRPVQGVLSIAVITETGAAGDALDNVFYVLGVERSRAWLNKFLASEVIFFLPESGKRWKMVRMRR
jgi:thiamine biosynthesis lipoprotein